MLERVAAQSTFDRADPYARQASIHPAYNEGLVIATRSRCALWFSLASNGTSLSRSVSVRGLAVAPPRKTTQNESRREGTQARAADLSRLQFSVVGANLPDQLAAAISTAIISGAFRPGDRVHPDEIAEHFEISKIPVREALRTVEANGWIRSRVRRGTFVASPSIDELKQVFETRMLLEPGLARLAAARRTAEQVKELEGVIGRTRKALQRKDTVGLAEANSEFHALVAACSGNIFAQQILRNIELRIRWYFSSVPLGRSRHTVEEHFAIFEAIRNADADAAVTATERHLLNTLEIALSGVTTTAIDASPNRRSPRSRYSAGRS
ncbi:GntR family transcriptional regulator [Bradyrhizobium liaoningense]